MKPLTQASGIIIFVLFFLYISGENLLAGEDKNVKRGGRLYRQYCSPCHGLEGNGRGPRAKNELLQPPPRDHTNGFYMNMVPDIRFFKVIKFGGKANNLSHIMPQWQHILSDEQIFQVLAHIRTLADPPYEVPKVQNWEKNPYGVGNTQNQNLPDPAQGK